MYVSHAARQPMLYSTRTVRSHTHTHTHTA